MIRKALLGTALTLGLGTLVFGTDVFTFARTAAEEARSGLRDAVPVAFEIKAARQKLNELDPAVDAAKRLVAEQGLAVERLQAELVSRGAALETQQREMAWVRERLGENGPVRYAGHTIGAGELKRDLAARLASFKVGRETLGHKESLLDARERTLEANERKLDGMLAARGALEVQIQNLEAKHQMVQARETMAGVEIDDTALADVKNLIGRIDDELAVRERLLDADGRSWAGEVPVGRIVAEEAAAQDAVAEFDALFPGDAADTAAGPVGGTDA